MPSDALAIAPVLLAAVLVVSGVGKLRAPAESARAFLDLRVPAPLASAVVVQGLPWLELALAAGLVLVGGPAGAAVGAVTLVLFTAYLVLVVRALGFDEDVECACFGALSPGRVTRRTVARNTWLLALAAIALGISTTGSSVVARIVDGRLPWWWLLAAAAAAVTTALVLGGGGAPTDAPQPVDEPAVAVEDGDYLRSRTPALPVVLGDGSTTTLRGLSAERPQLLLYVSETCGSCLPVIESVPAWREQLPQLDVRLVLRLGPSSSTLGSTQHPLSVHDTEGLVSETFDLRTPAAVLLGADGLLAGGPVIGSTAVPAFVEDVRAELQAALGA